MFRKYTSLMKESLRCESAHKAFQKLLDDGTYEYKAVKAYIIIDNAPSCDRRQLKWAKGYLKSHGIKFREIKAHIDAAWEEDARLYCNVYRTFEDMCPELVRFFESYM